MTGPNGINRFVPKYVQRHVQTSLTYIILITVFFSLSLGLYKGGLHLAQLKPEQITLRELPYALFMSFSRMFISYVASIVISFILGLAAARYFFWERLIIPFLDIMQSVPVVGFFPAAISFFIGITHGHRLGIEMAAVFLIFTSQAWNIAFSIFEACKTIPQDNMDAVVSFGVQGSQRFWKLYAPACVPQVVYNSILSWSNGWSFLVACEIIAVGPIKYHLPGIGSFLARAAEQDQIPLVIWGLLALTTLILGMDALIWRPLSIWAERFRQGSTSSGNPSQRSRGVLPPLLVRPDMVMKLKPLGEATRQMVRALSAPLVWIMSEVISPLAWDLPRALILSVGREFYVRAARPLFNRGSAYLSQTRWARFTVFWLIGLFSGVWAGFHLVELLRPPWPAFAKEIPLAILVSTARLVITLGISLLIVLPVIYWTWDRPKLRQILSTISQVGASLPAIALFPLITLVVLEKFGGTMEHASILLLMTGMVWYVMFNGLGGAAVIPLDLAEATRALGLDSRTTWKRLVLPAIRPALVTGCLTAWGGGWTALVVSEYVTYRGHILTVNGIGALLSKSVYELGDNRAIMLCIGSMVGWIIIINTLIWRPLYQRAAERYRFDA